MFRHTGFAAVAAAALTLAACNRKSEAGPTAPAIASTPTQPALVRDTLRGVVKNVVNDDSTTSIKLTTADGTVFTLVGPNADGVAADDGLEVWVSGELDGDQLTVETFALRGGDSPACEGAQIVDMPPDCLTKIEKLNPNRLHFGSRGRPR